MTKKKLIPIIVPGIARLAAVLFIVPLVSRRSDIIGNESYMRLAVIDTVTGEVHKPWCHKHGTEIQEE